MWKLRTLLLITLLLLPLVQSYNNIYEFDDNENIIISTTVYNQSGKPCLDCSCNLSVYYPYPSDDTLFISRIMERRSGGIYSINLEKNLSYNSSIYPISLFCNTTSGLFGGDDREGIKVGETLFDYTSFIIAFLGLGGLLLFASFKIDPSLTAMRILSFFGSYAFFAGAIFTTIEIAKKSPDGANFVLIAEAMFWALSAITITMFYFKFIRKMQDAFSIGQGSMKK